MYLRVFDVALVSSLLWLWHRSWTSMVLTCRSKENVNYYNILVSSQNDQTGSLVVLRSKTTGL